MKINEIVEAEGRIKQGLKDVGRGLGSIGKGVGVGLLKAFDKFAGGKGEVGVQGIDYGTTDEKQQQLAVRAAELAKFLKQVTARGNLPTEDQLVQQYIKQGFSRQSAMKQAEDDFNKMQDIKLDIRSKNPTLNDTEINLATKKEWLRRETATAKQPLPAAGAAKLAKDLAAAPGDESFAQTPPPAAATTILNNIKIANANPLVYQYGKQQYHLNGRGNWAKFPGEKEVPQTVAALLNQAADRDGL